MADAVPRTERATVLMPVAPEFRLHMSFRGFPDPEDDYSTGGRVPRPPPSPPRGRPPPWRTAVAATTTHQRTHVEFKLRAFEFVERFNLIGGQDGHCRLCGFCTGCSHFFLHCRESSATTTRLAASFGPWTTASCTHFFKHFHHVRCCCFFRFIQPGNLFCQSKRVSTSGRHSSKSPQLPR